MVLTLSLIYLTYKDFVGVVCWWPYRYNDYHSHEYCHDSEMEKKDVYLCTKVSEPFSSYVLDAGTKAVYSLSLSVIP